MTQITPSLKSHQLKTKKFFNVLHQRVSLFIFIHKKHLSDMQKKITVSDHFCVLSDRETVFLYKQGFFIRL